MAKIDLIEVKGGYNLSQINANFQDIETALNDGALWRGNPTDEPNQMHNVLDMNGNRIYNLPEPILNHEPVRKGDVAALYSAADSAAASAANAAISEQNAADAAATAVERAEFVRTTVEGVTPIVVRFSGNGSQTVFTLPSFPGSEDNTDIYVNGVYRQKNTYSISGADIIFDPAPAAGLDNIEVNVSPHVAIAISTASGVSIDDNGVIRSLDSYVKETRDLVLEVPGQLADLQEYVDTQDALTLSSANQYAQELLQGGNVGYQVASTRRIIGPDGEPFIVRGVQMFDYLFVSFETNRTDYNYRSIYNPPGKGPLTGISEPTYYAPTQFISEEYVDDQIRLARQTGANTLRVGVEPAIMNASVAYVDPSDGLTYPSDPEMLDIIINTAAKYNMVVQLQNSNDYVPTANNLVFLRWLAARYHSRPNVWINPANELNGMNNGGADVADPVIWAAEMRQYVLALREDIPNQPVGTKFLNPIAIDPPSYAYRLDLVVSTLVNDPAFSADPNLILNIHYYPIAGESDFRGARLTMDKPRWVDYLTYFCVVIGEAGIDNFAGRHDPNLDPGIPSVNPTAWGQMQAAATDFLQWCGEQCYQGNLQGVMGHMWKAWLPGLMMHDDNSMRRQDGTWATWGDIYRNQFLASPNSLLAIRRSLGAQYTTGAWGAGDIAEDAVINSKLGNMATGTIKGRVTVGTGDPEDLTVYHALGILTGLQAPVSHGSFGQPVLQVEGRTGAAGGAVFIQQGNSDSYISFYNRSTGGVTGSITGNGSTGTVYGTTSDARLKSDIVDVNLDTALDDVLAMRPVVAGWKDQPDAPRELMFLAHELQAIFPTAVTGTKDQVRNIEGEDVMIPQLVDYGRITPYLVAAIQRLEQRIVALEQALEAKQA